MLQSFSGQNIILIILATLIIRLLSPTMNSLGQKLSEAINNRLKHTPKLLTKILSQLPSFLFLMSIMFFAFYLSSRLPKDIVNFGDNTYIKRNKQTKELIVYTNGTPQISFSKDGLKVNKDLQIKGDIYTTDFFIDSRYISPDTVLDILKSQKGITEIKKEIAKEVSKEIIESLKTEGVIKKSPSK